MTGDHRGRIRYHLVSGLCLAALLALAASTPASAGSNDEVKGWIAALDLALTQPSGLEQEFAFQSNTASNPITGSRHLLDNDDDTTVRLAAGYDFGLGMGRLEVSYWSFDNGDSEKDVMSGYVFPTLFGYGYVSSVLAAYLKDPAGVRTSAASTLQANVLDVEYSRAMDVGDNFAFRWLGGLRTVNFDEDVSFSGTASGAYGYTYTIRQRRHLDSTARGIKVGGRGTFGFTKRFSMEGGVAVSLLQADVQGNSSQTVEVVNPISPFSISAKNKGEIQSQRGDILDVDLKGVWTEGPLSIYMGYTVSSWSGLVRDPNPARSPTFPSLAGGERDGVSFNSFMVGMMYRFGARRLAGP